VTTPPLSLTGLAPLLDRARAALSANPRLLWGLLGIAGILYLYLLLSLQGLVDEARADWQRAATSLAQQAANQAAGENWPERLEEVRAIAEEMEGRLWTADTVGLARAAFQQWLLASLREQGIEEQPLFEPAGTAAPGIERFQAVVTAPFHPDQLYGLIERMVRQPALVDITRLEITGPPTPRLTLTLAAYVRIPAADQGAP